MHHRIRRVFAFKQIGAGIGQTVLNGKFDLNNVFILGQHGRLTQTGGFDDGVAANVQGTNLRDEHHFVALDRVRHAPIETSACGAVVAPELGNHGLLTLLHNEKSSSQPNKKEHTQYQTKT